MCMEYLCGTDIIEVKRIKKAILETKGFKEKVFTEKEIKIADTKNEKTSYEFYAGRFAAKEAIYKAVSKIKDDFNFWEVEILNDKGNKNRPFVTFKNDELNNMHRAGILDIDISISHITDYATAIAVVTLRKMGNLT